MTQHTLQISLDFSQYLTVFAPSLIVALVSSIVLWRVTRTTNKL